MKLFPRWSRLFSAQQSWLKFLLVFIVFSWIMAGLLWIWAPPLLPLWLDQVEPAARLAQKYWLVVALLVQAVTSFIFIGMAANTNDDQISLQRLTLGSGVVLVGVIALALGRLVWLFLL